MAQATFVRALGRRGTLRTWLGTDPAANTEISETVPTGVTWELMAVQFSLVTDATAPVRTVDLVLDDGAQEFARFTAAATQAASLTTRYSYVAGLGFDYSAVRNLHLLQSLPGAGVILMPGARIRTITTNRAAGDNYGAPVIYVVEMSVDA